jgi:ribosomal protein L11
LIYNDNKHSKDFSGIVPDDQIKNVVTNEFSKASTVSAVVATVLGIAVALGLAVHSRF